MANIFKNNFTPTTGAQLLYELKTLLLAAGWILKGNGDGGSNVSNVADSTATPAGTDYITGTTASTVNRNWWRVKMAGSTQEFVIQHNNSSVQTQWRIKFSPTGFVGGSPSATQVPSATDEVVLCGGGTDASPSYTAILTADSTYRANIMAQNANPYGFWLACVPNGGGNPTAAFMLDPMLSADGADTHPYVIYLSQSVGSAFRASAASLDFTTEAGASAPKAYLSTTLSSANFVALMPGAINFSGASTVQIPTFAGVSPFNGTDTLIAPPYIRRSALSAPIGFKGFSTFMRWVGSGRVSGDAISEVGPRDRIVIGDVALPWDGSVPIV